MLYQFALILFGHVLGDVFLQMNMLSKLKRKSIWALGIHVAVWSGVISLTLIYLNRFAFWELPFLLITHFLIDWAKGRWFKPTPGNLGALTLVDVVDQFLHFLTLVVVFFA